MSPTHHATTLGYKRMAARRRMFSAFEGDRDISVSSLPGTAVVDTCSQCSATAIVGGFVLCSIVTGREEIIVFDCRKPCICTMNGKGLHISTSDQKSAAYIVAEGSIDNEILYGIVCRGKSKTRFSALMGSLEPGLFAGDRKQSSAAWYVRSA